MLSSVVNCLLVILFVTSPLGKEGLYDQGGEMGILHLLWVRGELEEVGNKYWQVKIDAWKFTSPWRDTKKITVDAFVFQSSFLKLS